MKKNRQLTQSRSVAGFKSFIIDKRTDDDLPPHIQGTARWLEVCNKKGYWVYNPLSTEYLAIEYEKSNDQWYFISQDSRTNHWVAIDTIPSSFQLGRTQLTSVRAAEVEEELGAHLSIPANTSDAPFHSTVSTQTLQAQAATPISVILDSDKREIWRELGQVARLSSPWEMQISKCANILPDLCLSCVWKSVPTDHTQNWKCNSLQLAAQRHWKVRPPNPIPKSERSQHFRLRRDTSPGWWRWEHRRVWWGFGIQVQVKKDAQLASWSVWDRGWFSTGQGQGGE